MLSGGKKEVEALTSTVQNLTDKLLAAETAQSEQSSSLAQLKDELEVQLKEEVLMSRWNEPRVLRSVPNAFHCSSS